MTDFPYTMADTDLPRLGLIVLQVDETIESDFRHAFAPAHAQLHITRIPSGDTLTPDTISTMEHALPQAASLLPPAAEFDVIGYACTSGTAMIGADRVQQLVQNACQAGAVTDPLCATQTAIKALDLKRIGILSPYIASVAGPLRTSFENADITVPNTLSFGEETEANVARIDPASLANAARHLAARSDLDGLFISCTNLRTFDIIDDLEAELGLAILSSNQTLAWHMARLANVNPSIPGRLAKI